MDGKWQSYSKASPNTKEKPRLSVFCSVAAVCFIGTLITCVSIIIIIIIIIIVNTPHKVQHMEN